MAERPSRDWDERLQRFLTDLRSGTERRSWDERREAERRAEEREVETEHRHNDDRRGGDDRRVTLLDRRRRISNPYVQQHAEQIRSMLLTPGARVVCPRCSGDLLLGPPLSHGDGVAREVRCTNCRHCVVITDLPEEAASPQPGED